MTGRTRGFSLALALVGTLPLAANACGGDDGAAAGAATPGGGADATLPGPGPAPPPVTPAAPRSTLDAREVEETVRRVADFQLDNPVPRDPRHWSLAPLYDGLIDATLATRDPRYLAAVIRAGRRVQFRLGSRTYHADGHAAGHAWLRLYLMQPADERDPAVLQRFVTQFDEIVGNPITADLSFAEPPPRGLRRTDRWTWADALYMSPPTISLLAQATGDQRYLHFMDREFRFTYDALFDPEAHLWYRDATYINLRTPNGRKVFWSRGNAWVYAGLALTIDRLPAAYPNRPFYVGVFQEMSPAVLAAQQPDGFWYTSLADPAHVPVGETSGTALFTLGMAWGIRQGLLDPAMYQSAVDRGWNAILTRIEPSGAVTFVQPFGEAPAVIDRMSRETYGTGAVLMAGTEILRALDPARLGNETELFEAAQDMVDEVPDLTTVCVDCVPPEPVQ